VSGLTSPHPSGDSDFGPSLRAVRERAGLSPRKLAKSSGVDVRRITELERSAAPPTDRELGALAQACRVSVFDLLPPGYVGVLAHDDACGAHEVRGAEASDALLREYLSMVLELRSNRVVTAPTLRHDDLVELAAALGDTPEAIEVRLVALLDTDAADADAIRSMILPSTAD
jgi:transcriptional regulator with XRE-family HTH domain